MRCNIAPYAGNEEYIFVSYCHKDKQIVYPYIESLASHGYRIWYDEGIDPGEDWPEIIAQNLSKCSFFLAFVTKNSINSHNCRREINFAIQQKKKFTAVLLDDAKMTVGMEMVFSTVQAIKKSNYGSHEECVKKIIGLSSMKVCLGKKQSEIVIHEFKDKISTADVEASDEKRSLYEKYFVSENKSDDFDDVEPKYIMHQEDANEVAPSQVNFCPEPVNNVEESSYDDTEETVLLPIKKTCESKEKRINPLLFRLSNKSPIFIDKELFSIGRSISEVDFAMPADKTISRKHSIIKHVENDYYIVDNNSLNHVLVNGEQINQDKDILIRNNDFISIGKENFVFIIRNSDDVTGNKYKVRLTEISTGQEKIVNEKYCRVGRTKDNNDVIIKKKNVSRMHAVIFELHEKVYIVDLNSANGTYVNGEKIKFGKKKILNNKDLISFGYIEYQIRIENADM